MQLQQRHRLQAAMRSEPDGDQIASFIAEAIKARALESEIAHGVTVRALTVEAVSRYLVRASLSDGSIINLEIEHLVPRQRT